MAKLSAISIFCATILLGAAFGAELQVPADHPVIQDAINAAQPGDIVVIAAGTYQESIRLPGTISLRGAGADSTIVEASPADGAVLTVSGTGGGTVTNLTFRHIAGTPSDEEAARAVVMLNATDITMKECSIQNGWSCGIAIENSGRPTIGNCRVESNAVTGVWVRGAEASPKFLNNVVANNGAHGLYIEKEAGGDIAGNTFEANKQSGIAVHGWDSRPKLDENICRRNEANGIHYTGRSAGRGHSNKCEENFFSGIAIDGLGTAPDLQGNTLRDNRRYGLSIDDESRPKLHGNELTQNGMISRPEIQLLFEESRYDDLETIAERLRTRGLRFPSGEWQIGYFYQFLTDNCGEMEAEAERAFLDKMSAWEKAHPDSVTWRTVLGEAYIEFAWRQRGGGYANTVTADGWRGFSSYLQKADTVLTKAETLNKKAPEIQSALIVVSMGLNKDDESWFSAAVSGIRGLFTGPASRDNTPSITKEIMARGLAAQPQYYPLYYRRAQMLLPRWGGPYGALEDFAAQSADSTRDTDGEGMYARIAAYALHYVRSDEYISTFNFDWVRIKKGFEDILRDYPDSNYRLNDYALMACVTEHRDLAKELFERIGDNWDGSIWVMKGRYLTWRDWADGRIDFPVGNALCEAVRARDMAGVQAALRSGAKPNNTNEYGRTALYYAVDEELARFVTMLIENGADPNNIGHEDQGPIHRAVSDDTGAMLDLLLKHGADPNKPTVNGSTPILLALHWNSPKLIDPLLALNVDVTIPNNKGFTPLHYAARDNRVDVARRLLEMGAQVDAKVEDEWTPLHYAARYGATETTKLLLEKGADVTLVAGGSTPLRLARNNRHPETAAVIEQFGGKMRD